MKLTSNAQAYFKERIRERLDDWTQTLDMQFVLDLWIEAAVLYGYIEEDKEA